MRMTLASIFTVSPLWTPGSIDPPGLFVHGPPNLRGACVMSYDPAQLDSPEPIHWVTLDLPHPTEDGFIVCHADDLDLRSGVPDALWDAETPES
jgi:hypothetical protein